MDFRKDTDLIFFYIPEASVIPHLMCMCLIAKDLQHLGYNVVFGICSSLYNRCPVMDMNLLSFESSINNRESVCPGCIHDAVDTLNKFQLPWINLGDYISTEKRQLAETLVKGHSGELEAFCFENVPIGKIAIGDYAIGTKNWNFDPHNPQVREAWEQYATSAVISYSTVLEICKSLPVRRFVRFNEYANNLSAHFAARTSGIPSYTIAFPSHMGTDLSRILVFPKVWIQQLREELRQWDKWRDVPLPSSLVSEITEDVFDRFKATSTHTYSPSKTRDTCALRDSLNCHPEKKLLVAFTSSPDERSFTAQLLDIIKYQEAPELQTFSDHIEWLKCLINFAEKRDDVDLVIRIHPREGANKRESIPSQHLSLLKANFSDTYTNCRIIWPEEQISSYDLMEIADVGLTAWSTMGIELARLGVPTVTAFRNISFPDDDFHRWGGPTPDDYLNTIVQYMSWEPSYQSLARAYRCYHKYRLGPYIDCESPVPSSKTEPLPNLLQASSSSRKIEEVIVNEKDVLYTNLEELQNSNFGSKQEYDALYHSLRAIITYLAIGLEDLQDQEIVFEEPTCLTKNSGAIYIFGDKTNTLWVSRAGVSKGKYSPLTCRLLKLVQEAPLLHPHYSVSSLSKSALSLIS